MWLIRIALRRPITVIVLVVALALSSVLAIMRTRVDIFPNLNLPVIYVAQPYGGMSPQQMEGFVSYYYEYHFLYINGIESVEAKSIQGTALLRLTFHPETNMSDALAQTISYVNRARAFMPPGTVSPFVIRYDAGTLPVGYMVFSSPSRTLAEIQDLALNRVRPVFATLPGVSSPPPFGGNQRTIVINVDPQKMQAYGLSPEKVVQALTSGNSIQPAGNADIGTTHTLVTTDSTVTQIGDLLSIPLKLGPGASVYIRDVGSVSDSSDLLAGYALLNGTRTIYIPVTKRPDASTLTVVKEVRQSLARFQSLVPEDIKITYEFDQSQYVRDALMSVLREAIIGALLTGLTLLLFLRGLAIFSDCCNHDSFRFAHCRGAAQVSWTDDQHHDAGGSGPCCRRSGRRGDGPPGKHPCSSGQRGEHFSSRAPCQPRGRTPSIVGDALGNGSFYSIILYDWAGPIAFPSALAGCGFRHGRIVPAVEFTGSGVGELDVEA